MSLRTVLGWCAAAVALAVWLPWGSAAGQQLPIAATPTGRAGMINRLPPAAGHARIAARPQQPAAPAEEHPLMPALRWAYSGLKRLEDIQDYSAIMVKRERIDGELREPEYMYAKVRHRPLSVYLRFLKPEKLAGREVIWIEGANKGKMWAHGTGVEKMFGTVSLDPTGPIAMRGNRYPITEIGVLNLVRRLIEVAESDIQYGECEVKFFEGAKINGRSCTCIQV
ncbi:MAG TPA: DUF1571 domain-containing protein, partial [Planctomycetaceae bacterium]|nr:DUF1571 domain-containing protein [Planctomycetaceae bacterium]